MGRIPEVGGEAGVAVGGRRAWAGGGAGRRVGCDADGGMVYGAVSDGGGRRGGVAGDAAAGKAAVAQGTWAGGWVWVVAVCAGGGGDPGCAGRRWPSELQLFWTDECGRQRGPVPGVGCGAWGRTKPASAKTVSAGPDSDGDGRAAEPAGRLQREGASATNHRAISRAFAASAA